MAIYQGDEKIVDRYVGETLVTRAYQGDKLIFDAYSELSGTLPLAVRSRASQVLKNYRIYGASGSTNILPPQTDTSVWDTVGYIKDDGGIREDQNYRTTTFLDAAEGTLSFTNTSPDSSWYRFGWYDENQLWLSETSGYSDTVTVTPPASAVYMRISINTASDVSFVTAGSAGGVGEKTENLFNIDNPPLYSYGYYLNSQGVATKSSSNPYWYITDYIKVNELTAYYLIDITDGNSYGSYTCFYDSNKNFIGSQETHFQRNKNVTTPQGCEYMCVSRTAPLQTMIIMGDEIPDHYIPYGYKLPLKVTASGTTTDYPLYIGDSQLMRIPDTEYADYVDYENGKIVRYIKEYTFTGDESFSAYGAGFTWATGFSGTNSTGGKITTFFSHFTARANAAISLLYDHMVYLFGDDCACFRSDYSTLMLRSTANFTTAEACKAYFKAQYDNGTPVKMWYALATPVEEDPPAPFPDITLPQGTATIDIDGELKPQATVKGRINPTV